MELVYLWVEDYKNIHEQGFNFSPRLHCEYDDIKKELTIDENNDYISDFFGENINVTAIVGKNGSGKSSVLKNILENILKILFRKDANVSSSFEKFIKLFIVKNNEKVYILYQGEIANKSNDYEYILIPYIFSPNQQSDDESKKYTKFRKIIQTIFPLYYDYRLYQSNIFSSDSEKFFFLETKNDLDNWSCFNLKKEENILIRFLVDNKHNEFFKEKYFTPNRVELKSFPINFILDETYNDKADKTIRFYDSKQKIKKNLEKINKDIKDNKQSIVHLKFIIYYYVCILITKSSGNHALMEVDSIDSIDNLDNLDNLEKYILKYLKNYKLKKDLYKKFQKIWIFLEDLNKNNKDVEQIFIHNKRSGSYNPSFISFSINHKKINKDNIKLLLDLPPYFEFNFYENEISYSALSSGEKSILRIRFAIEDILKEDKDSYLILLDEPANDMHPDWQKKLLNYLINIFKNRKQKFHFIFTTHSPFMISDLPKENIIFIKDGKNNKGLNHTQTFGANIHTLLSDSFFMKDGLMGEFAKNKIQEIMDYLNNIKTIEEISTKEEQVKQVIESIGEPFLRRKLLDMYYTKYKDESLKEARKKELEAQKRQIEEELKRL